jgi:topoisomerase IV subunit B
MRLSKVEYAPRPESAPILNFYMGKNTPECKNYIIDSLVVPVKEGIAICQGFQRFSSS